MLEVSLLGQFDVWKDGVSIYIPSRPAQSLLAYLLLTAGIVHPREKLSGLLWPGSSDDNARRNLRQALWRVRKSLNDKASPELNYLLSDQFSVGFNPKSKYWLDVSILESRVKKTLKTDPLMDLLKLYRGELLPGFYYDWVMLERERLQAVFERGVERLLTQLNDEHRWTEMLEWGENWLAYGQNPEPAYRGLMHAYGALGNHSKVVYIYERCIKALQDDLEVDPSEQTRKLYEQLVQRNYEIEPTLNTENILSKFGQGQSLEKSPYKGLQYYDEVDAELFFGRDNLTDKLVTRLNQERFLAVIGASGSGKSSLVRAGLVPAIKGGVGLVDDSSKSHNWKNMCVQVITPTEQPLGSLASTLVGILGTEVSPNKIRENLESDPCAYIQTLSHKLPEGESFVLIVDQFEELFTLCHDPFKREAFVDHLLSASCGESSANFLVVIALRSDFYSHCAYYDNLRQALVKHQEFLGSMSIDELRRIIEEPAKSNNWELEAGLTDLILTEIGEEPGRLPLLSHALFETWNQRNGRKLTLKGYTDSGGVRGAISQTAESLYQKLLLEQQEITKHIFLHLTEVGGTTDTRRRILRSDLIGETRDETNILQTLDILADARLITLGEDTIEVAHEALIRTWGRLKTWLDDSRDELNQRRALTVVAQEWEISGRDSSYLTSGARLSQFEALKTNSTIKLGNTEKSYLEVCQIERNKQRMLEKARIAHEARLEQRSQNVLRTLVIVLLVATLGALVLTSLAWDQRRIAQQNEVAAQALALTSGAQFAADQGDFELALALALEANRRDPSNVQSQLTLSELAYAPGIRRRFVGHTDQVSAVAFSPQGKHALSASWDQSLILWDVIRGQAVRQFNGHTDQVTSVVFAPDGETALSGSADNSLILWNVNSGKMIRRFEGHNGTVTSIAINSDGSIAVSSSADKTLIIWDLASGRIVHTLKGHASEVQTAAFSPNGKLVASGSSDNNLIVWDVITGKLIHRLEGHLGAVTQVTFSPDGKSILTGSLDQVLILWNVAGGKPVRRYEGHHDAVNGVAFNPDGTTFISAGGSDDVFNTTSERILILWDVASGEILRKFKGHTAPVTTVAFNPDGKTILSGSADMSLILWGVASGAESQRFEKHTSAVNSVSLSADGEFALSGSADTSLIIWDLSTGQPIRQFSPDTIIHASSLSPDGKRALSGSPDGRLTLWNVTTGKVVRNMIGHTGLVTSISFNPDGKTALSASIDRTMILWDVESGKALRKYTGHTNAVTSAAFRQDGKQALSGSFDRTMILWDIDSGQVLRSFPTQDSVINTIAFSPDGNTCLSGLANGTIILWNLELGTEILRFTGHSGPVFSIAFSPDGQTAISGSMDRSIIVWDVKSGQPVRRFLGHTDAIRAVTFSPDGQSVLSGSLDNSIRIWRIDSQEDLITWTENNRSVIDLPCEQRSFYQLEPLCEIEKPNLSPMP